MRVAVIGLGYWGSKVFGEYVDRKKEGKLDGVVACDIDESNLEAVDSADARYTSVENAIEDVDAVHISTGNKTHYDITTDAIENNCHALVEKPLTTNRKKAYDLVEAASETGQILQTGHIFRFANVMRKLRELYRDGYFGEVYHFSLQWTHKMDLKPGTNVFWDLLPHPLDILNFVTGEWPDDSNGLGGSYRTEETTEAAYIQLQYPSLTADVHVSWVDPVRRRTIEVVGSDRSAVVECVDQTITVYDENNGGSQSSVDENNTIKAEQENFLRAIKTGENTFNSAIVGARTVDAIQMIENKLTI
jgi:predicted dehydrogenase